MRNPTTSVIIMVLAGMFVGCDDKPVPKPNSNPPPVTPPKPVKPAAPKPGGHSHHSVRLGEFSIGGIAIQAAQGHGTVEAGKQGHLVVKLPYKDDGSTVLRAWIGTEDRTRSSVGKGAYARSHDDYDIHAVAPDPLPEGTKWWVEIEKPDGTKIVGSVPLLKDIKGGN